MGWKAGGRKGKESESDFRLLEKRVHTVKQNKHTFTGWGFATPVSIILAYSPFWPNSLVALITSISSHRSWSGAS